MRQAPYKTDPKRERYSPRDAVDRLHGNPFTVRAGTMLLASDTVYFNVMGRARKDRQVGFVRFFMSGAGSGAQAAEVGIFRVSGEPAGTTRTLTLLKGNSTLSDLTTGANTVKGNTVSMAYVVPAGTIWAIGVRVQMGSGDPTVQALARDWARGTVYTASDTNPITSGTSWTGSLIAVTGTGPDLVAMAE